MSRKEEISLQESSILKDVFQYIPDKMHLLKEISELDEKIQPFKDEILKINKDIEKIPSDVIELIKKIENILEETLSIEGRNNEKITEIYQKKSIPSEPLNIVSDNKLRAMKAYGK